jgi:hypothetical protein
MSVPSCSQAQEFVTSGAKAVTGSEGQGAESEDDWQPTLWRGLGFDFSNVLHAHEASMAVCQKDCRGSIVICLLVPPAHATSIGGHPGDNRLCLFRRLSSSTGSVDCDRPAEAAP